MIQLVSQVCSPSIEKLKEWSLVWVNSRNAVRAHNLRLQQIMLEFGSSENPGFR